jgi:hypothetical protein
MDPGVLSRRRPGGCVLLGLVQAVCLCLPPPAAGQTPSSLNLLRPLAEDRAKVDVFSGANRAFVRGRLLDVTDSALVLEGRNGSTEVAAADVREVWSPGGPRFRTPLIVGTAVGLGLGLLAKAGEGDCSNPASLCATDGPVRAGDIVIMTALGTASGLGWAWWKRQPRHLLYISAEALEEMGPPPGAPASAPEAVRPDWLALARLEGGTVEVAARSSEATLKGTLLNVTPQVLRLLVDGEPYVLRQADVRRVWSEPRTGWWRVPVGSLYYGTAWAAMISIATCGSDTETDEWSACYGKTWGITTGVVAAIIGYGVARQRHAGLTYDASRPAPAQSFTFALQPTFGRRSIGIAGACRF